MSDRGAPCSRRRALQSLAGGVATLALLPRCGPEVPHQDPPGSCGDLPGTEEEGWVEVPLAEHPALEEVGGASPYQNGPALLDVLLVRASEECYLALWRNCTHGACHVEWSEAHRHLECPCHGSLFGEDGEVLKGPATRALRTFRVLRDGNSLWIHRPR